MGPEMIGGRAPGGEWIVSASGNSDHSSSLGFCVPIPFDFPDNSIKLGFSAPPDPRSAGSWQTLASAALAVIQGTDISDAGLL